MTEIPAAVLEIPEIRKLHKKLLKTERKRLKLEITWLKSLIAK